MYVISSWRRVCDADRRLNLQFQFNPGTEAVENSHQSVERETTEIGVADAREIRRRDAGARIGLAHR